MTRGKNFKAEQIIGKLREAEVELDRGKAVPEVVGKLVVSEQTHHRWKREYGGLRTGQAKRPKDLERGNARLKRFLAAARLDKAIRREAASGDFGAQRSVARPSSTCVTRSSAIGPATVQGLGSNSPDRPHPERE